jgi:hypothetical protein
VICYYWDAFPRKIELRLRWLRNAEQRLGRVLGAVSDHFVTPLFKDLSSFEGNFDQSKQVSSIPDQFLGVLVLQKIR